jgi:hypothetical protein
MTMTERTVSVELTHDEVVYLQTSNDACSMLPGGLLHKLYVARSQFDADRDREAKVEFIRLYHLFESNPESPESALYRINEAGWDLVRMEDK